MVLFGMLGTLMFISKIVMEVLPNVHLLGALTMTYTVVFRKRALIPIYVYVMLNGLFVGFSPWWVPYLYIWTALWGVTMLLPQNMPRGVALAVYPVLCSAHGLLFGILYSPVQALMFGFDFNETVAWIIAGSTFDVVHAVGNFVAGMLVLPLSELLKKLLKKRI